MVHCRAVLCCTLLYLDEEQEQEQCITVLYCFVLYYGDKGALYCYLLYFTVL